MSLANIILQRPAGYLLTDTGCFNRDGTIAQLSPKVLELHQHGIAITCRGQHDMLAGIARELEVFNARHGGVTGADIIGSFAELYRVACSTQGVPATGSQHACDMQILYYCRQQHRTRGYLISNETTMMPGLQPFALQPVGTVLQFGFDPDAPFGKPIDMTQPAAFDVRTDGIRLANEQRATSWAIPGRKAGHFIAGSLLLTTIDAAGVRTEAIHTWPDKVGERVVP